MKYLNALLILVPIALVMEFGDGQEEAVRDAADRAGWQVDGMLHDLQGIARTIILRR